MAVEYCLGLEDNRRKTSTFFLYIYIYIFKSDVVGEVWREFCWGAIAGAFGEGMMHPVDTVKTRIQSQAILSGGIQARIIIYSCVNYFDLTHFILCSPNLHLKMFISIAGPSLTNVLILADPQELASDGSSSCSYGWSKRYIIVANIKY